MSRVIYNDHPWSDDEIAYQLSRGRVKEVEQNKKNFPPGSEIDEHEVVLELSHKVYDYVSSRTFSQLKAELKKRHLSTSGDETELRIRLAQHLQELEDGTDA